MEGGVRLRLKDLDASWVSLSVVILQTASVKLSMFLEDRVKRHYHCRSESIITISGAKDFARVREVMGITPPFSDRWFVGVDLSKHYTKELVPLIKTSPTCVFFCTCTRYKEYKRLKDELKGWQGVCDFYLGYLNRVDFVYLYDLLVPAGNRLSKQLFDFVMSGYSSDVDAVMGLFAHLASGGVAQTRGDITELCGLGGNTTESYVVSLLKPLSGSDKGLKVVMRNRVRAGLELAGALGYGTLYNFMAKTLLCFIELKQLMIAGVVYKSVRNLPKSYDEQALSRYQKYLWRLREIPMTKLLTLRGCMGDTAWHSELDMVRFLYSYYGFESIQTLRGLKA